MLKSNGWPLRRVVEEFKTKEGKWKERLDCGHVIERHPTFMKHYRPERRRCQECALEKERTG
jgi:hypothetical protein